MRFFSEYFVCYFCISWPKILRIIFTPKTICFSTLFSNFYRFYFWLYVFHVLHYQFFYCCFSKIISNLVSSWVFYFFIFHSFIWGFCFFSFFIWTSFSFSNFSFSNFIFLLSLYLIGWCAYIVGLLAYSCQNMQHQD